MEIDLQIVPLDLVLARALIADLRCELDADDVTGFQARQPGANIEELLQLARTTGAVMDLAGVSTLEIESLADASRHRVRAFGRRPGKPRSG